ncbi:MAG TPA: hypothetical protein VG841_10380 [Caulobacterales bacterium]|nr:hypothetical protein [Caulobacterales bacterium]
MSLAACASAKPAASAPAWFAEAQRNEASGYPKLQDVPQTTDATTDPHHWAEVRADVIAAGQAMKANPRSEPAAGDDTAAFMAEAQQDLAATAAAHAETPPPAPAH